MGISNSQGLSEYSGISSQGLSIPGLSPNPPSSTPLRIAEVSGWIPIATDSAVGMNRQAFRWPAIIGADMKDLVVLAQNYYENGTIEAGTGNAITILEMSIESSTGVVVPVTFSGSRSVTMASGDFNITSDVIPASSFSLSKIPRDAQYWMKGLLSVTAPGGALPYSSANSADVAGSQAGWYLDSATTPSSTDAAGAYTVTGVPLSARFNGFRPILLGHPVTDGSSFITFGDSLAVGVGDGTANGAFGRGYIQRAMHSGAGSSYPNLNLGRSGAAIAQFINTTKWKSLLQYAKYAIDEMLTNDVATRSVAQMQTDEGTLWTAIKAGGIQKIIRTELMLRTNTTDDWATTANQTVTSGWENTGKVTQLNTWFPTKVSDGTINQYVSGLRALVADGTATDKWAVPKVNNNDDVHLNTTGCNVAKVPLRTIITTI